MCSRGYAIGRHTTLFFYSTRKALEHQRSQKCYSRSNTTGKSGTTTQWQGVTLLGTSSGLLVNKGTGLSESFDTTITVPHGKFTSTNILRFGFSQHGHSDSAEDMEVTDASFTFNVQNTFTLTDILSIATSSTKITSCGSCDLDFDDANDVGYEFIGKGSCWTDDHVHPSTHENSDVGVVTPQACYERCIERYVVFERNISVFENINRVREYQSSSENINRVPRISIECVTTV